MHVHLAERHRFWNGRLNEKCESFSQFIYNTPITIQLIAPIFLLCIIDFYDRSHTSSYFTTFLCRLLMVVHFSTEDFTKYKRRASSGEINEIVKGAAGSEEQRGSIVEWIISFTRQIRFSRVVPAKLHLIFERCSAKVVLTTNGVSEESSWLGIVFRAFRPARRPLTRLVINFALEAAPAWLYRVHIRAEYRFSHPQTAPKRKQKRVPAASLPLPNQC